MDAVPYFCLYLSACCFVGCYLTGNDMHFDFVNFIAFVGCSGGALSLLDFAWFAYYESNIDYSLPFLAMVVAVCFVCAFRRKSE